MHKVKQLGLRARGHPMPFFATRSSRPKREMARRGVPSHDSNRDWSWVEFF